MIEIIDVRKSFEDKPVLRGVDLVIPDQMSMVILGSSGCGKTVLLRSIIGLFRPDTGKILVDGEDIGVMDRENLFRVRMKFGMLFQGAALFDSMTVEENIGLALREHTKEKPSAIRRKVSEKLELVGLPGIENKKPAELSGGMKKRVGLARALVMDPKYLLFDEPTTGLDPVMADAINDLIIETQRKLGVTSVVVTHDMASAFKIADRMAMIQEGKIIFDGEPSEFCKSKNDKVRQFIEKSHVKMG
jgi:phospholipid/cholesterol/gamma-HCH transport system ATP-binding protein